MKARQHAASICRLGSREERVAALEDVPDHIRPLVRKHVENYFFLRKSKNERIHN